MKSETFSVTGLHRAESQDVSTEKSGVLEQLRNALKQWTEKHIIADATPYDIDYDDTDEAIRDRRLRLKNIRRDLEWNRKIPENRRNQALITFLEKMGPLREQQIKDLVSSFNNRYPDRPIPLDILGV